jgi:hypothetical protein
MSNSYQGFSRLLKGMALKSPRYLISGDWVRHYETRIITPMGMVTIISHGSHPDDSAAVRVAKSLCRDGEMAEVWRGDFCVYSEYPETKVALVWPLHSVATGDNRDFAGRQKDEPLGPAHAS